MSFLLDTPVSYSPALTRLRVNAVRIGNWETYVLLRHSVELLRSLKAHGMDYVGKKVNDIPTIHRYRLYIQTSNTTMLRK